MHVQAGIIDGNELGGLFTFQTADGRSNEIRRWDLTSPHPLQPDLIINRLSNTATPVPSALVTGVTTVAVVAGNLTITGDNNDDIVTIRGTGVPGQYEVTTLQATTIQNGVAGSILIDLGAGSDSLTLDNALVAGAIQINTGVGHDTVHLGFDHIVSSAGNTMVSLGDGDDVLIGRRIFIGGNQSTDAGAGNDTVAFLGAAAPGNFVLGTSSAGTTTINGQGGNDDIPIQFAFIVGNTQIDSGADSDNTDIRFSAASGPMSLLGGFGSDVIVFDSNFLTVSLLISGGNDNDRLEVRHSLNPAMVQLDGGLGADHLVVLNLTAQTVSLTGGTQDDTADVRSSALDSLFADLGDGNDTLIAFGNLVDQLVELDGGPGNGDRFNNQGNAFTGAFRRRNFELA